MKLDPIRALRIIEGIAMECENEVMGNIYMVAHQAGMPACAGNHPDFATKALEIEAALVKAKVIDAWPSGQEGELEIEE